MTASDDRRTDTTIVMRRLLVVSAVLAGCASAPTPVTTPAPVVDDLGCVVPPPDVFTKLGITADIAELKWGDIVFGGAKIEQTPEVISLVSQAAIDYRVQEYLRCRAMNDSRNSPAFREYTGVLSMFMQTKPTPAEFIEWQRQNPAPTSPQVNAEAVLNILRIKFDEQHQRSSSASRDEAICDYLDDIADSAKRFAGAWEAIAREIVNAEIELDPEARDRIMRKYDFSPSSQMLPFSELRSFYAMINGDSFEKADWVAQLAGHLETLLNARGQSRIALSEILDQRSSESFVDPKNRAANLTKLSQLVDVLKGEAAAIAVLAKTVRLRVSMNS